MTGWSGLKILWLSKLKSVKSSTNKFLPLVYLWLRVTMESSPGLSSHARNQDIFVIFARTGTDARIGETLR